jgi:hypothetical protein
MSDKHPLFVVVTLQKKIRNKRYNRGLMIYSNRKLAEKMCQEGDSVVEAVIDFERAPLFVKGEVVDPRWK